jgi:hypothetical protein
VNNLDEVKECFNHLWDKASYQCNLLKREIEKQYPYLTIVAGLGALDNEEHDSSNKEHGAPDLYIYYGQKLICAIEVTGSDKVSNPWKVWIGKHKIDFARKQKYPIGFFFFFGGNNQLRLFTSFEEIKTILEPPEVKTIRGLNFEYHILDVTYFKGESSLWNWLQCCIDLLADVEVRVI